MSFVRLSKLPVCTLKDVTRYLTCGGVTGQPNSAAKWISQQEGIVPPMDEQAIGALRLMAIDEDCSKLSTNINQKRLFRVNQSLRRHKTSDMKEKIFQILDSTRKEPQPKKDIEGIQICRPNKVEIKEDCAMETTPVEHDPVEEEIYESSKNKDVVKGNQAPFPFYYKKVCVDKQMGRCVEHGLEKVGIPIPKEPAETKDYLQRPLEVCAQPGPQLKRYKRKRKRKGKFPMLCKPEIKEEPCKVFCVGERQCGVKESCFTKYMQEPPASPMDAKCATLTVPKDREYYRPPVLEIDDKDPFPDPWTTPSKPCHKQRKQKKQMNSHCEDGHFISICPPAPCPKPFITVCPPFPPGKYDVIHEVEEFEVPECLTRDHRDKFRRGEKWRGGLKDECRKDDCGSKRGYCTYTNLKNFNNSGAIKYVPLDHIARLKGRPRNCAMKIRLSSSLFHDFKVPNGFAAPDIGWGTTLKTYRQVSTSLVARSKDDCCDEDEKPDCAKKEDKIDCGPEIKPKIECCEIPMMEPPRERPCAICIRLSELPKPEIPEGDACMCKKVKDPCAPEPVCKYFECPVVQTSGGLCPPPGCPPPKEAKEEECDNEEKEEKCEKIKCVEDADPCKKRSYHTWSSAVATAATNPYRPNLSPVSIGPYRIDITNKNPNIKMMSSATSETPLECGKHKGKKGHKKDKCKKDKSKKGGGGKGGKDDKDCWTPKNCPTTPRGGFGYPYHTWTRRLSSTNVESFKNAGFNPAAFDIRSQIEPISKDALIEPVREDLEYVDPVFRTVKTEPVTNIAFEDPQSYLKYLLEDQDVKRSIRRYQKKQRISRKFKSQSIPPVDRYNKLPPIGGRRHDRSVDTSTPIYERFKKLQVDNPNFRPNFNPRKEKKRNSKHLPHAALHSNVHYDNKEVLKRMKIKDKPSSESMSTSATSALPSKPAKRVPIKIRKIPGPRDLEERVKSYTKLLMSQGHKEWTAVQLKRLSETRLKKQAPKAPFVLKVTPNLNRDLQKSATTPSSQSKSFIERFHGFLETIGIAKTSATAPEASSAAAKAPETTPTPAATSLKTAATAATISAATSASQNEQKIDVVKDGPNPDDKNIHSNPTIPPPGGDFM